MLLLCGCFEHSSAVAEPPRPFAGIRNVVLIVIDTLRADHLHCYGYPRRDSDAIDAVANQGLRFENCYCAWPETCQSMAALLSGMYCQTNGVVLHTPSAVSPDIEMLPETLRHAGWQTAAFVTNNCLTPANHFDQGFEGSYFECTQMQQWRANDPTETFRACKWIHEHAKSGPFFTWIHYIEPHAPYRPRKPERFVSDRWYDPSRRVKVRGDDEPWNAIGGIPGFSRIDGHDELAWYVAQYDSEIVDADEKIAKVLDTLAKEHLDDSTLVIITGDHGEGFGEHNYYWHGRTPFDDTSHVPLILRAPGIARGIAKQLVSTIDLAPTILEMLGQPVPSWYEGQSLLAQFVDPARTSDRLVFTESGISSEEHGWQRSVRDREWKLIWAPDAFERQTFDLELFSLYHVAADPGETINVLDGNPEVAERLRGELNRWVRADSEYHAGKIDLDADTRENIRKQGYATEENDKARSAVHGG